MNKNLLFVLVVVSMLAFTFTSAFQTPPPPAKVAQVSLISMGYQREKGVTFKFLVSGDVRKSDMRGTVIVAGKTLRLYCNYSGDPTPVVVVCTSAKATAKYAGNYAVATLLGRSFWFIVPGRNF